MASGQGYLRQRSKGTWTCTISLGKDSGGKHRQLVRTIRGTKAQAQAEMARLILERDQGVDLRPQLLTCRELIERWLTLRRPSLAATTFSTYETLLRVHVLPLIGHLKLRDLKPLHVESINATVINGGGSTKLALNVFRLVDAMLAQALRWQLIARNPADAVEAPRPKPFVPRIPSLGELEHLFSVADDTPYGLVARLALLTGARQGELLHLLWRDVDFENSRLHIRGTKTAGSNRQIDLGPTAIDLLRRQRQAEKEKRLKLGPRSECGGDDATVFTNLVGRPIDAGGLKRTWKRIVQKAGVGQVRFHDLRHANASYLLQAGAPVRVVSERLGHSRTSTTTDVYAHVLPGAGQEAAALLENMVNSWSRGPERAAVEG